MSIYSILSVIIPGQTPTPASKPTTGNNSPGALITAPATFINEFNGPASGWETANWSNGDPFNTTWQPDNVAFNNGIMSLVLDDNGCPGACRNKPFASGEYRTTKGSFGYGYYEVRLKAAKGDGLVTSFFTYTGTYGKQDHHEIDFEVLGKNTNQVQLNFYVEGQGNHEKVIDLGFDAAEGFHNYGFHWTKDQLTWYVDGKPVHSVKGQVPYKPGKIMVNLWPGTGVDGWLEPFNYPGQPVYAQYDWVKFSPLSGSSRPVDQKPPVIEQRIILPSTDFNPAIGKFGSWELVRDKLDRAMKNGEIPLEQIESALAELADIPPDIILGPEYYRYTAKEFEGYYPALGNIRRNESTAEHQLYWYLSAFNSHWNNVLTLFCAYADAVIKSGSNRPVVIAKSIELAEKLRFRNEQQSAADLATNKPMALSSYGRAVFDLKLAELYSQTKGADYGEAINRAHNALAALASLQDPDYFMIFNGLMVLGDLYQQIAHSLDPADKEEYLLYAKKLYSYVIGLDPASKPWEREPVIVSPPLNQHNGIAIDREIAIFTSDIERTLDNNISQGKISEREKEEALVAVYFHLKGIAQIKLGGLFAFSAAQAENVPAAQASLIKDFELIEKGKTNVRVLDAFKARDIDPLAPTELQPDWLLSAETLFDKLFNDSSSIATEPSFFYSMGGLTQGEILLTLADNIKYHRSFNKQNLDLEQAISSYKGFIDQADRYFNQEIAGIFPSLQAWAMIKQIEIATRTASYVKHVDYKTGRPIAATTEEVPKGTIPIADTAALLAKAEEARTLLNEINGPGSPDYLSIELDYLTAALLLDGIPEKTADGRFIISSEGKVKTNYHSSRAVALLDQLATDIQTLPELNRTYFDILIKIKAAQADIQNETNDNDRRTAALKHLDELIALEKVLGEPISPHIERQALALPDLVARGETLEANKVWTVLQIVLKAKGLSITGLPDSPQDASTANIVANKIRQVRNSQPVAGILDEINLEELTLDIHSIRAELYHLLASIYALDKNGPLMFEYTLNAYLECANSSSRYDHVLRPQYIFRQTKIPPTELKLFLAKYPQK